MANVRITKDMAKNAASKMRQAKYSGKIKEKQEELKKLVFDLIDRYVPKDVVKAFNGNKDWYSKPSRIGFHAINGGSGSYVEVYLKDNTPLPPLKTISVSADDYVAITRLQKDISRYESDGYALYDKLVTVFVDLAYEKRIREQFPQAVEYFDFGNQETAIAPSVKSIIEQFNLPV